MLDGKDYPSGSLVYSFIGTDGTNIHVDSEKLRVWCAEHSSELEVYDTPVSQEIANSFLVENVIDLVHVLEVMNMKQLDPVIYGHDGTFSEVNGGPNVYLIDGHHRFFAAAKLRLPHIPGYVLKPEQWQAFQIIGLPNMTREQLIAAPTKAEFLRRRESRQKENE